MWRRLLPSDNYPGAVPELPLKPVTDLAKGEPGWDFKLSE